ncbi:unnamed protein product [Fusarium equiseti]|uniref:Uncharacterized protein n=1 Tax=Fusarium equiseti TaxID=61235 RepID=A0A8J2ILI7_FUSEQ|nr:unnamed protein product [Fusarium equiseti]
MTRVKPGERKRARTSKVKTGCGTCKWVDSIWPVRDEIANSLTGVSIKATIRRSTSTGRKCDGYQSSSSPLTPESSPRPILATYSNGVEAESFQFFIEKTLDNFQTFFTDDLWSTRILQVAQEEDCIKNGVVALSHFHRHYLTHQQWRRIESVPALKHYNLAIKELLTPSPDTSSRGHVLIISCLIFICIELLQGKTDSAIGLFKYGCNMIQQHRNSSPKDKTDTNLYSDTVETFKLVEACFKRIAVQFLTLISDMDPSLWFLFYNTFGSSLTFQKGSFTSLADAREALLELLVEQATPGLKGKSARDIMAHAAKVNRWGELFDTLLSQLDDRERLLNETKKRSIALLQLHRKYLEINVAKYTLGQGDPCFWDNFTPEFEQIVKHAATAAGLDEYYKRRTQSSEPSEACFHIDLGFTSVLIAVIARCRDPFIRRRALAVMLAERVQEGVFNASQSAKVAARVMELEESRSGKVVCCSGDIPQEARVRTIRVHLSGGDDEKVRIVYGFDQGYFEEEQSMAE